MRQNFRLFSPSPLHPSQPSLLYTTTTMSAPKSRWASDDPETEAIAAQQKREKEERKRAKAEKQRQEADAQAQAAQPEKQEPARIGEAGPPKKRRRLSNEPADAAQVDENPPESTLLRFAAQEWGPCRHAHNFERLNHIEEGSYGYVTRAKDITTGEVVALKKLKMENSPDGFPVTGLREIQTLLEARHPNVVYLREIVMGNKLDE
jgi:cell division cycle 2-like protein